MIYTIEEIVRRIKPVVEKYQLPAVYLFGSYARGTATESSDIDLIVDTTGTSIKGLFSLGSLYCDLESALEKDVDVITVQSLQQTAMMASEIQFRDQIWKEKVDLYAVA
ncbi:MAG: nucleotidyltransferase domain-containing protein [Lachnospiraceae bacterium]|nr:nucleotidyltransferase domain-containing protein [Clostridiales bacterium]MCD7813549.1 nucleotidyltransferase domain-containing protein [Lachnospiraceae bacterium]MCD7834368.1 nucleotidyltransferase domain-containing protein [Lachnospiraceae bacterium]